ncbi:carboxypeptidase regulatory-like domain-containing protein [Microbulbifer magnicolonia]|uniref:carboxypeptidase regulatory-like domain-containing protein n=1 Tax=Microbulbifer magnicolonia TaxID=3109744 RepID=UPI002B40A6E6|nr:carboxypeptidase regulatory-like domain-containing protein [Microbulbifer sp. GG15]
MKVSSVPYLIRMLIIVSLVAVSFPSFASLEQGYAWLGSQQQMDGGIYHQQDIALPEQSTSEALEAVLLASEPIGIDRGNALSSLETGELYTESLARRLLASVVRTNSDQSIADLLRARQNPDGGFANAIGAQSNALDTCWAIRALESAGESNSIVRARAIGYLMDSQESNGSWSYDGQHSSYLTSCMIEQLVKYRNQYSAVANSVADANNYLIGLLDTVYDGSESETFIRALVLSALSVSAEDVTFLQAVADALLAEQAENGSWNDDVYVTALSLRGLKRFQARLSADQQKSGAIKGGLVIAGSMEPIAGATVTVVGGAISASTNQQGEFVLSPVMAGSVNLLVEKEGFSSTSVTVDSFAGEIANAGTLALSLTTGEASLAALIVDEQSKAPLSLAKLTLSGDSDYELVTASDGSAFLGGVAPGEYLLKISAPGYYDLQSSVDFVSDQVLHINQGLLSLSSVLDDFPRDLTGIAVDGETGEGIAGASISLGDITVVADPDGHFVFTNIDRGEYRLMLSAAGYVTTTYALSFPAGSNGIIGNLPLHRSANNQPADLVNLSANVYDALSQAPVPNARVIVDGIEAFTDADGRARISNIGAQSFQSAITASNYLAATYQIEVGAYGSFSADLVLTPEAAPTEQVQLSGLIQDLRGVPIVDARVEITETGQAAVVDDLGSYSLSEIDPLTFTLQASAPHYQGKSLSVELQQPGSYELNVTLDDIPTDRFHIVNIEVPSRDVVANDRVYITAAVRNLALEPQSATIRAQVFNEGGEWVADIDALLPGTELVAGTVDFAAEETLAVQLPWNTAQNPAGSYKIIFSVLEPGSVSRTLPGGVALASASTTALVRGFSELSGGLAFVPPMSQFGSESPVELSIFVRNLGNQELPAGSYQLTMRNDAGEELLARSVEVPALAVNEVAELNFANWVPQEAGHLSVSVHHTGVPEAGNINAIYYVGDVASGEFVLDQAVFPEGDNLVGAHINLRGVDNTQGSSTDPLLDEVRAAVTKGGQYVGPNARNWHSRNRCLGCHIQTQSLVGLASSLDKADIDPGQAKFLYNAIASSQQSDGSLRSSHSWTKTPTSLGLWSLAEWPDRNASYRTRYRAAEHLMNRRSNSGAQTYWTADHSTGWQSVAHEGITAIVAKSFAELIETSEQGEGSLIDYNLGDSRPLALGSRPAGMVATDQGLLIAKRGGVELFDPASGETTVVYQDNSGRNLYDVAVGPRGEVYVSGHATVTRITADGTVTNLALGNGHYTGIVYWRGGIYVTEPAARRVWKLDASGQWQVFASGGLVVYPDGLAVSDEETLLVSNGPGAFNILEIDAAANISVFADGFSYPPFRITPLGGGEYLVTTGSFSNSGLYTPHGLNLLRADGTLERLFSADRVNGTAAFAGHWYVTNESTNSVQPVVKTPMPSKLIGDIKETAPRIANYFLARAGNNDSQTLYIAFRLVGLAELRKIIADESMQVQMDEAIAQMAERLRSRQRADGGWGQYVSWGSDPLTTAWVGIALDYTNPSSDDPMVRNAITYLLNSQSGGGDWWGRYFSTRLGTTSMVMAYMPKAIERLGGLDVGVDLSLPPNIALSDPSVPPASSDSLADGTTEYRWDLTGVTANGQKIDFNLSIADLQLGEIRPVAKSATIEFANSFTDEIIPRELEVPAVTAASELALTVGTDQSRYTAYETVNISVPLTNNGPDITGGTLHVQIRSAEGQQLIAELELKPAVELVAGQRETFNFSWNTGNYRAGDYRAYGFVSDQSGRTLIDGSAAFAIDASGRDGNPDVRYGVNVSAEQPVYPPWSQVRLDARVSNLTVNDALEPALAKLVVTDPQGEVVLNYSRVIPELTANVLRDFQQSLELRDASSGRYDVALTLWNAQVSERLAKSSTQFVVEDSSLVQILGTVEAAASVVPQGDPQSCTDTLHNRSATREVNVDLQQLLLRADDETEVLSQGRNLSLASQQRVTLSRGIETADLALGNYICVLRAVTGDSAETLGYAVFTVVEPPIEITGSLEIGAHGRLLALIDADGPDPHGDVDVPDMGSQRSYLEVLLDAAGWSYTIVDNADDFDRELKEGGYSVYALFSEQVKLSKSTQQALVDRVASGDGLLSGGHDRRNRFVEAALGIEVRGNSAHAKGATLEESVLGAAASLDFDVGGKVLTFAPAGAEVVGHFSELAGETSKGKGGNAPQEDNALALFRYGSGRSMFTGFDLLANAAARAEVLAQGGDGRPDSPDNAFARLLLAGLEEVHPQQLLPRAGKTLPLALQINNEKRATPGRALLLLSGGLSMVDADTFVPQQDGSWSAAFNLAEGESRSLTIYVRLPGTAASEEVGLVLQSGEAPDYVEQQTLLLPIAVQSP